MENEWSGEVDWSEQSYSNLSAGLNTFKWAYEKDCSVSTGYDCAWIDDVNVNGYEISTGIDDDNNYELGITNYELKQNYPNPFNPVTKINYKLQITNYEFAEIVVYNAAGQMVWSSPVTRYRSPVTGSVLFDGSSFNSGIYYYSLIVDGKEISSRKMILMK